MLAAIAEIFDRGPILIWIFAGACIVIAVLFCVLDLRTESQSPWAGKAPGAGGQRGGQRITVILLLALFSSFAPPVRNGVERIGSTAAGASDPGSASAPIPSIVNRLSCPVRPPTPYDCRNGRCARGGSYPR